MAAPDYRAEASEAAKKLGLNLPPSVFKFETGISDPTFEADGHHFTFFPGGGLSMYRNGGEELRRVRSRPGQGTKFPTDEKWAAHAERLFAKLWPIKDLDLVSIAKTKERELGTAKLMWLSESNRIHLSMKQDDGPRRAILFHASFDRHTGQPLVLIRTNARPWPPPKVVSPGGSSIVRPATRPKAPAKPPRKP